MMKKFKVLMLMSSALFMSAQVDGKRAGGILSPLSSVSESRSASKFESKSASESGSGFESKLASESNSGSKSRSVSESKSGAILQKNEHDELKLAEVLDTLNCSKTLFGRKILKDWLFEPAMDVTVLRQRQNTARGLVENKQKRVALVSSLQNIADKQDHVLAYYAEKDELNDAARRFYLSLPQILTQFKAISNMQKKFNNSSNGLASSMAFTWLRSLYFFMQSMCLSGVQEELMLVALGAQDKFNMQEAITRGLKGPWRDHMLYLDKAQNYGKTYKEFVDIKKEGTLGDRIVAFSQGYNAKTDYNIFGFTWGDEQKAASDKDSWFSKMGWKVGGPFMAVAMTAWHDYNLYAALKNSWAEVSSSKEVAQKLHKRLLALSAIIKDIDALHALVASDPLFAQSQARAVLDKFLVEKNTSKKMQELLGLLRAGFKTKLPTWYPTGNMLIAQKMLHELKDELKELLLAIGEVDAYYGIARLFVKHQEQGNKICFVEFVESDTPQLDLQDLWIPLPIKLVGVSDVVTNTVQFGCAGKPAKMILTGPNGCGKSTILKPIGQSIALGQSWTIAPASKARMTIFHGMKICFDTSEDLNAGLSTYMAVDDQMAEIESFLDTSNANNKCIALIDEPWRGTTDSISARRIYDFGKHAASLPHCIVCIATHTQKPIELAADTQGAFSNTQVTIKRGANPKEFERTFKLADGPAWWWFNDEAMQLDFVDWLKQIYRVKKADA